jgi:cytochrome c oxidase subunit II
VPRGSVPESRARLLHGLLAGLVLFGCEGPQSALDPKGPLARQVFNLSTVMFVGGGLIFVLVLTALVGALVARRAEEVPRPERGKGRVVLVATATTVLLLVALLVYDFYVHRAIASPQGRGKATIEVVGHQWWWEVNYLDEQTGGVSARTANELHIPVGRRVLVNLKTRDVIHSFWVPHLQGKMDMIPGRTNQIALHAEQEGVYRGQCAEFCGLQHAKMSFYVVAESPERFRTWLERQREPAVMPDSEETRRGQEVFLTASCALCHAIRGTQAMASAGPDLTHFASRRSLGAATLPSNRGNLGGWILDPAHLKPGVFMTPSPLDGRSLNALLHYLEILE